MAWTKAGLNFRATSGYVTDGADQTYVLDDDYPTTRDGVTFGYVENGRLTPNGTRDRNNALDPRLAGMHFTGNSVHTGTQSIFRIDLPQTGVYNVKLALGDATNGQGPHYVVLRDTDQPKLANDLGSTAAEKFYDASGVLRTSAADWLANNVAVAVMFSTTIANFKISDPGGGGGNTAVAHIELEFVDAGTSAWTSLEFNFRETRNYMTDPAGSVVAKGDDTADPEYDPYPTTRGGATFGWIDSELNTSYIALGSNRSQQHVRHAGYASIWNGSATSGHPRWRLDVTGVVNFALACGCDTFSTVGTYVDIRDGLSTQLHRIAHDSNDPGDCGVGCGDAGDRYVRTGEVLLAKGPANNGVFTSADDCSIKESRTTWRGAAATTYAFALPNITNYLMIQLLWGDSSPAVDPTDSTRVNWMYIQKLTVAVEPSDDVHAELTPTWVEAEVTPALYDADITPTWYEAELT